MKALSKALACASFMLSFVSLLGQTSSWRQAFAADDRFSYALSAKEAPAHGDTLVLSPFMVFGKLVDDEALARKIDSALKARSDKPRFEGGRIAIVPDLDPPMPGRRLEGDTVFGGKQAYLESKDIFEIELPGGNVLKAQFRSGVSFKLDNGWRLIIRPSRSKLVRFTKDF